MTQVTIPAALGGDGLPFSDDGTSARDMQGQGYATNFFPMVAQAMGAVQMGVQAAGAIATASTNTSSTTSLAIGTGAKALTVETGKALVPGMWVLLAYRAGPTNSMTGQVTSYDAATGALVLNVTAINGAGTFADWAGSVTGAPGLSIPRVPKTGAYTLTAADKGALIDCSGTWTLGFTAAATLGAGWWCYLRNTGTGTITADPNASELIDGVTSGAIRPGMTLLVMCDGAEFHCVRVGPQVAMEVLTSGTSWTCPLGVRTAKFWLTNGGAAGGGGNGSLSGAGGAGGSTAVFVAATTPATAYTYAIGAAAGTTQITINGTTYTGTNAGGTGKVIASSAYTSGLSWSGSAQPGASTITGFGRGGSSDAASGSPGQPGGIILEY